MAIETNDDLPGTEWQWALPENLRVPPDPIRARIDIHHDSVVLHLLDSGVVTTHMVAAIDIAQAFTSQLGMSSDVLPERALWWTVSGDGVQVALWRSPAVWPVALQLSLQKPAERLKIPLPGLVFVCQPNRAPRVYAAKRRPRRLEDQLFYAPLLNVYEDGMSCAGSHKYSADVEGHPEAFFLSFFTRAVDGRGRSKRFPDDLGELWAWLNGRKRFPVGDLRPWGTVKNVMERGRK